MDHFDNRVKLDVFKEKTTQKNDYKKFPRVYNRVQWEQDRCERPIPPPPQHVHQDHETFQYWKENAYVPFDLFWKPKEIIRTNPTDTFTMPSRSEDPGKEEAMKTRPRIYMSPAVSMDDVADPEMRRLLCKHMYTTEWGKAMEETAIAVSKKPIPNTTYEIGGDPVKVKLDFMPPLHHKLDGMQWEKEQLRASVDPTKDFWINKDPPVKCGACVDPVGDLVSQEVKSEIRDLIKNDKLRLAHDLPISGYAGYKPRLSYGVSLSKVDLPMEHPFLSTTQAITKRYASNK